jgi:hypothetical protein
MQVASWVNPARLQRGGKLKGNPVGVLERQDRDAERWQVGDVAVLHAALLERLHCRLQLSPPGHAETQMVKAAAEGVEAVAGPLGVHRTQPKQQVAVDHDNAALQQLDGQVVMRVVSRRWGVHFVLQAARSANVGEMTGRATVYMGAVSSALIAFGFLAQVVIRLDPFVAAVLPAVFLLGEFTFAALVRNTLENLVLLRQMQRIRGALRLISMGHPARFSTWGDCSLRIALL